MSERSTDIAAGDEIERLRTENWQLKQACGYPIPADKETPQNPFKCGICDARALDEAARAAIRDPIDGGQVMKAFQQILDDDGRCDLAALRQAIIDNTKGNGFWLGEILLATIERETGFGGSSISRPLRQEETK